MRLRTKFIDLLKAQSKPPKKGTALLKVGGTQDRFTFLTLLLIASLFVCLFVFAAIIRRVI